MKPHALISYGVMGGFVRGWVRTGRLRTGGLRLRYGPGSFRSSVVLAGGGEDSRPQEGRSRWAVRGRPLVRGWWSAVLATIGSVDEGRFEELEEYPQLIEAGQRAL